LYGPEAQDVKHVPVDIGEKPATDPPVVTLSDGVAMLRPWSNSDANFLLDACADPAIQRYSVPTPPRSIAEAAALIDEIELAWQKFASSGRPSGVAFAIADAASADLVGLCGIDEWSKADVAQIGYWITARARGRGFATRGVILLTRWLFELGAARVFLTIVADNVDSIAVARRAGFAYEGTMRSHGVWQGRRSDVMWFAALPLEWTERGR
jgi:RimJ/RimL family protein N-acetyltransferase